MTEDKKVISIEPKRKEKEAELEKQGEALVDHLEEAARYQAQLREKREADRKKKNDAIVRDLRRGRKP